MTLLGTWVKAKTPVITGVFAPSRGLRAGDGNRTRVIGLEDRGSTIKLHPRKMHRMFTLAQRTLFYGID
jgi:hypothetical protein